MFPSFEVIPAVDIKDGQVVQLVQGDRDTATEYGEPVEAATRWMDEGARTLHLVDLDGAFEGKRHNASAVESIVERVDIDIQLGGGIRSQEDARRVLDLGIDRVILGTAAVESPEIVADIAEDYPDAVVVSLDARDGEVVVQGWTESTGLDPSEVASRFESLGAAAILFTNVDVEGRLDGVDTSLVRSLVRSTNIPVIASGGVASIQDLHRLHDAGAAAAVVGTALYEQHFTLDEAMESFR